MLLTDTDSLVHKIEAGNVYEDFYRVKKLFDFCNYPKELITLNHLINCLEEFEFEFEFLNIMKVFFKF